MMPFLRPFGSKRLPVGRRAVTATNCAFLIVGEVWVLLHGVKVKFHIPSQTAHDRINLNGSEVLARFNHHGSLAVTQQDFYCHFGVGLRPPLSPLGSAQIQFGTALIAPSVLVLSVG